MKIVTHFSRTPIPDRRFDWSAVDEDSYDADCDEYGYISLGPIGRGPTKEAAIADLLQQLEDA